MSNEVVIISFQVVILILSVVVHEVAHGVAALMQGDPTAKFSGRLTLNPLKHLDPWGSFIVPILMIKFLGVGFGWAKPVPYNPYNLRNQRTGPAIVGIAGPLSNICIALVFGIGARFIVMNSLLKMDILHNFLSGNYGNLADIISGSLAAIFFLLFSMIVVVNLFLAFFNLIPIPPLDGSKLLFALLPIRTETKILLEQFGFMFLLVFIFLFSSVFGSFLSVILSFFFRYVIGI